MSNSCTNSRTRWFSWCVGNPKTRNRASAEEFTTSLIFEKTNSSHSDVAPAFTGKLWTDVVFYVDIDDKASQAINEHVIASAKGCTVAELMEVTPSIKLPYDEIISASCFAFEASVTVNNKNSCLHVRT